MKSDSKKQRGGKRPGSGRKKKEPTFVTRITKEEKEVLRKLKESKK